MAIYLEKAHFAISEYYLIIICCYILSELFDLNGMRFFEIKSLLKGEITH